MLGNHKRQAAAAAQGAPAPKRDGYTLKPAQINIRTEKVIQELAVWFADGPCADCPEFTAWLYDEETGRAAVGVDRCLQILRKACFEPMPAKQKKAAAGEPTTHEEAPAAELKSERVYGVEARLRFVSSNIKCRGCVAMGPTEPTIIKRVKPGKVKPGEKKRNYVTILIVK